MLPIIRENYQYYVDFATLLSTKFPNLHLNETFLCKFRKFVIVSNNKLYSLFLMFNDSKTNAIPSLETQRKLIERFEKAGKSTYFNLFHYLVGEKIFNYMKNFRIFYINENATNCLFNLGKKEFWFKNTKNDCHDYKNFENWANVGPTLSDIIQSIRMTYTTYINSPDEQLVWKEFIENRKLSRSIPNRFLDQLSKNLSNKSILYSNQPGIRKSNHHYMLNRNSNFVVRKAILKIFGKHSTESHLKIEQYIKQAHQNYLKCNIKNLLNKYCPLPLLPKSESFNIETALTMNTSHKELFKFLYAFFYTVFPAELFGSKANCRKFYSNLKILISANYNTEFRPWEIANGIDLEKMKPLFSNDIKNIAPICFLCWIYDCINCLIRSTFYVTESSHYKYLLFFYRYDIWSSIRDLASKHFIQNGWFIKIDSPKSKINGECLADFLKNSSCRFIPKKCSIRPITALRFYRKNEEATNCINMLSFLLRKTEPNANMLQWKLHDQIKTLKQNHPYGPFYIVRGDFENCYPSILSTKMLSIISEYLNRLVEEIDFDPSSIKIEKIELKRKNPNRFVSKKFKYLIFSKSDNNLLKENIDTYINCVEQQVSSLNYCIITPTLQSTFTLETAIKVLKLYLTRSSIRVGKNTYFELARGIRQGGPLSTQLCSIYLNHLWRKVLPPLQIDEKNEFFLNIADDFVFVTTNYEKAKNFAITIRAGFPLYNLKVNENKCVLNFDLETGIINNEIVTNFFGRSFSSIDLSICMDLSSFENLKISDTFFCNPFTPILKMMKLLTRNYPSYLS